VKVRYTAVGAVLTEVLKKRGLLRRGRAILPAENNLLPARNPLITAKKPATESTVVQGRQEYPKVSNLLSDPP